MSGIGIRRCASCSSEIGILLCSACKTVGYCSKACQKKEWLKSHKDECKPGENKLAGTTYVAFPPETEDKVGKEKHKSFDNDFCLGQKVCSADSLNYLSDAKYGKYAPGKLNVVVFWAQFHKPGYKFLPFYSVLAAKYKDQIQFVGVSVDPDDSYPKKFLADPAKKYSTVFTTEFAVAHDEGKKLKESYGEALRDTLSLPHAFVVNAAGEIVWHQDHSELGNTVPNYMHLMEEQLDNLLAGKALVSVGDKEEEEEEDEEDGGMDLDDDEDFSLF